MKDTIYLLIIGITTVYIFLIMMTILIYLIGKIVKLFRLDIDKNTKKLSDLSGTSENHNYLDYVASCIAISQKTNKN